VTAPDCSNIVYNPVETGNTQKGIAYPISAEHALKALLEAWNYRKHDSAELAEVGVKLGEFIRGKPYSRVYILNILNGKGAGEELRTGILSLLAIVDGARVEQVKTHPVECLTEHNVHPGALILTDSRLCRCGLHFIPRAWNQRWHSKDCPARKETR